jgi:BMFP domain-containing protein YqiC
MINGRSIDELARSLVGLIPPGMDQAAADVEKSMKATLMAGLRKLDLVTREEFEVQRAVLLRTREKLEQLERELDALQSKVDAG